MDEDTVSLECGNFEAWFPTTAEILDTKHQSSDKGAGDLRLHSRDGPLASWNNTDPVHVVPLSDEEALMLADGGVHDQVHFDGWCQKLPIPASPVDHQKRIQTHGFHNRMDPILYHSLLRGGKRFWDHCHMRMQFIQKQAKNLDSPSPHHEYLRCLLLLRRLEAEQGEERSPVKDFRIFQQHWQVLQNLCMIARRAKREHQRKKSSLTSSWPSKPIRPEIDFTITRPEGIFADPPKEMAPYFSQGKEEANQLESLCVFEPEKYLHRFDDERKVARILQRMNAKTSGFSEGSSCAEESMSSPCVRKENLSSRVDHPPKSEGDWSKMRIMRPLSGDAVLNGNASNTSHSQLEGDLDQSIGTRNLSSRIWTSKIDASGVDPTDRTPNRSSKTYSLPVKRVAALKRSKDYPQRSTDGGGLFSPSAQLRKQNRLFSVTNLHGGTVDVQKISPLRKENVPTRRASSAATDVARHQLESSDTGETASASSDESYHPDEEEDDL
ncbi:MAG: hypothetical protein M1833_002226 [Piccolia ochrophora]|nr:MAG: hypothetical protein M1833_002226 [Piccolia ochrophora]